MLMHLVLDVCITSNALTCFTCDSVKHSYVTKCTVRQLSTRTVTRLTNSVLYVLVLMFHVQSSIELLYAINHFSNKGISFTNGWPRCRVCDIPRQLTMTVCTRSHSRLLQSRCRKKCFNGIGCIAVATPLMMQRLLVQVCVRAFLCRSQPVCTIIILVNYRQCLTFSFRYYCWTRSG